MHNSNVSVGSGLGEQEGFSFSYHCGNHRTTVQFDAGSCDETVRNFLHFMLGCGYSISTVAEWMTEIAEEYTEAECKVSIKEIPPKWKIVDNA